MARALTSDELTLLRKDGQFTKLYLAVLNPNTVYTARLASLPSSFDNVSQISVNTESGTLSNVKPGMTIYVGTSAGAFDLGVCRVRKAPITGTWYIGLTSEITWQSTCYLTITDDFDWWAKHAALADSALVMDVDIAYSDQHSAFSPVPILGPHVVLWLTGATISVQFDGSSSWVFGSTITGHSWSAPGASATSGLTTATPTITYNAAGCYRVLDTVTAANGKTTTGVRHVFVYDEDHMPATVFQLAQCQAEYETGGWMFDVNMEAEASLSEIRDRSLVVLFAEDWYGIPPNQVKQSIGPITGRENIVCVGRVVGQSIRWDRESGNVHFVVQGAHYWLNKIKGFPIQIQPATVASSWSQMPLMTVDRILWHILYWHSTVIETMDFYPTNDTKYTDQGMSMASSVWGQLVDIAFSKILASPFVDRFGRLFIEVDPQAVPEASRSTIPTVMALTDDDWQEGIDLQRMTVGDCSLIRLTSQLVNETGSSVTLYSLAPGHTPRRYGEPEMLDRLLAVSQAQSNQIAGLVLGWRVNEFPDVPVVLLQNNRMFDLAPHQFASLDMAASDNPRGVAYDGNLIPRRVSLYHDSEIGFMHPELNFEGETFEQLSTNGDIPDTDADDLTFPPILSLPSLDLPDIPIILPGTIEPSLDGTKRVLMLDANKGLVYSEDFATGSPHWILVNGGLGGSYDGNPIYSQLTHFRVCLNGCVYAISRRGSSNWTTGAYFMVARAPSAGGTFTILHDPILWTALYGSPASQSGVMAFGINPLVSEQVVFLLKDGPVASGNYGFFIGAAGTYTAGLVSSSLGSGGGENVTGISYGMGGWLQTKANGYKKFDAGVTSQLSSTTISDFSPYHFRASTTGKVFVGGSGGANGWYISDDDLATGTWISTIPNDNPQEGASVEFAACDPTGQIIMAPTQFFSARSFDGGASWSSMASQLAVGGCVFAWVSPGVWLAFGGTQVYESRDNGATWTNKTGNLGTTVGGVPSILQLQALG